MRSYLDEDNFCDQRRLIDEGAYTKNSTTPCPINITTGGVLKLLGDLKNGKSPDPDGIPKEDLLIDPAMTASRLTSIFNASLSNLQLPTEWKLAPVTPLFKKGAPDQPNNYRPISLTSVSCKVMEHILLHWLNKALDKVLCNWQHEF